MNDFLAFFLGFLLNFFTSAIFLLSPRKIQPFIQISGCIAQGSSSIKEREYMFKVVNCSKRDLIDIKAELFLVKPFKVDGGFIREFEELPLVKSALMEIKGISNKSNFTDYDFCFKSRVGLAEKWRMNPNYFVLFRLQATDSVSGFKKVFSQEYYNINQIIPGEFVMGRSMKIES